MSPARLYVDHNARAPLHPAAREAMRGALDLEGNPSSPHAEGQAARRAVEQARAQVAQLIHADPRHVVFTSGATESVHAALHGALRGGVRRVVVPATEHHAVLDEAERLRAAGVCELDVVAVDDRGRVDVSTWRRALAGSPAVAAFMAANNETGVLHDVPAMATAAREAGAFVLVDAAQAPGRIGVDVAGWGAHAVALSACKFGGPPGVGVLWLAPGGAWSPPRSGGAQERGRRPGTENLPGILGAGAAAAATARDGGDTVTAHLRDTLEARLRDRLPHTVIHGSEAPRLPNTTFAGFPGVDAQALLVMLDLAGIAASSGSACVSGSMKPSHVLLAMGVTPELARASIRISFGPGNTGSDVHRVVDALVELVPRARLGS